MRVGKRVKLALGICVLLCGVAEAVIHVSPPIPGTWVPKRWKNVGAANTGGNGPSGALTADVGPTWNSVLGDGLIVTDLNASLNRSVSQSADGILQWTVACPPGATPSWTLTTTANGNIKREASAALGAIAEASDQRKLTYTGDAKLTIDVASLAVCDSRTTLALPASDPKSVTGWSAKTANGTTACCTTKSEVVKAEVKVAALGGVATGATQAKAGGNVTAPLIFTGKVDLNNDGVYDYSVTWTDMGQPGVPKPPVTTPPGVPPPPSAPGPVVTGGSDSPYGGPNPNGEDPGWEPEPFSPPEGYNPGSPPPQNGQCLAGSRWVARSASRADGRSPARGLAPGAHA